MFDGKVNTNNTYRAWTCDAGSTVKSCADANNKLYSYTSGIQKKIKSDFLAGAADGVENNYGASYRILAQVVGIGGGVTSIGDFDDAVAYKYYKKVILKGSISGVTFPTQLLELQLKLQNFLSLKNIT